MRIGMLLRWRPGWISLRVEGSYYGYEALAENDDSPTSDGEAGTGDDDGENLSISANSRAKDG